ncbi:HalOD1 output domain-containing protein [Halobacterium jilantaiense]|uniref:Halobacterial output domain-containing protein n=1 Tax=Halobacterium jilantaiense TaxID=355548 RepID=A0A1I0QCJ5_9EURY|nr:HalOD1 output domain-containing protein [Halobacterium jilantaiense]SEW24620.1 hypothetical protein SAMN04487945_2474 [Halobacterium jilantaiense]
MRDDEPSGTDADVDVDVDENGILQFGIEPDPQTAEYDLLTVLADHEDIEMDDLPSLYSVVDQFVGGMFDDPPSESAQLEMTFSYAGYRITVTPGGHVTMVPVKDSMGEATDA